MQVMHHREVRNMLFQQQDEVAKRAEAGTSKVARVHRDATEGSDHACQRAGSDGDAQDAEPVSNSLRGAEQRAELQWPACGTLFAFAISAKGAFKAGGSAAALINPAGLLQIESILRASTSQYNDAVCTTFERTGQVPSLVDGCSLQAPELLDRKGTEVSSLSLVRQLLSKAVHDAESRALSIGGASEDDFIASLRKAGALHHG
jgi:hypothetical protein